MKLTSVLIMMVLLSQIKGEDITPMVIVQNMIKSENSGVRYWDDKSNFADASFVANVMNAIKTRLPEHERNISSDDLQTGVASNLKNSHVFYSDLETLVSAKIDTVLKDGRFEYGIMDIIPVENMTVNLDGLYTARVVMKYAGARSRLLYFKMEVMRLGNEIRLTRYMKKSLLELR